MMGLLILCRGITTYIPYTLYIRTYISTEVVLLEVLNLCDVANNFYLMGHWLVTWPAVVTRDTDWCRAGTSVCSSHRVVSMSTWPLHPFISCWLWPIPRHALVTLLCNGVCVHLCVCVCCVISQLPAYEI